MTIVYGVDDRDFANGHVVVACSDGKAVMVYDDFHVTPVDHWSVWEVQREYELNQK